MAGTAGALPTLDDIRARHRAGETDAAIFLCEAVLREDPENVEAWLLLATLTHERDGAEAALDYYQHALGINPHHVEILTGYARCLRDLGRLNDAATVLRKVLASPDAPASAHVCMGGLFLGIGEHRQAQQAFARALSLSPGLPEAIVGSYQALSTLERLEEFWPALHKGMETFKDNGPSLYDLAVALEKADLRDRAILALEAAVAVAPDHAEALFLLGTLKAESGYAEEALPLYRRCLETMPAAAVPGIHSTLLMAMHYVPGISRQALFDEHRLWGRRYCPPAPPAMPGRDRDPERRLRVGFVSANFRHFAAAHFLLGVLDHRPDAEWEAVLYSNTTRPDGFTERFQAVATLWRDTSALSDEALVAQVRSDGIDLLFDLDGHTRGNRLLAFARRMAPVQAMWLDYVDTTGVAAMDYLIYDAYQAPPAEHRWYTETVLNLPGDHICYSAPDDCPPVAPLPARKNGSVTFGCCNGVVKINPAVVDTWGRILNRIPDSRLFLNTPELRHGCARIWMTQRLDAAGIERQRIVFGTGGPHREFLEAYGRIDIALDTFPYSGGLTTCEALWMGVPVVSFPGDRLCSRHAAIHSITAGYPEFVAPDVDGYVDTAVALAGDLDALETLRADMRARIAASPLTNVAAFSRDLSAAIRTMWRAHCTAPFDVAGGSP